MAKRQVEPGSSGLLSPIGKLLADPAVSEIMVNKPCEVYFEKSGIMSAIAVPEFDEVTLSRLFQLIAHENAQVINDSHPLMSASLKDGSRIQLVLPPVAKYPSFALRRKVKKEMSLDDYETLGSYQHTRSFHLQNVADTINQEEQLLNVLYQQQNWPDFLKQALKLKKNIIISGGTSSGKTTFLNACLAEIPRDERLIFLEDVREIEVPHENKVHLLASKGEQGVAKLSMQDLLQCSLRLRPDRIICGEIRGKEVLDFIGACITGHEGSMTSIHANNPKIAFMRMVQMYKLNNVPFMTDEAILAELQQVVDVIVQLVKDRSGRRVDSIYFKPKNCSF